MDGFKLNSVLDVYVGSTLAKYVYLGSTKIWDYKTPPVYTAPTVKTGLVYNGSAQQLLNAGSTSHGTFQYSSDGSTWSTLIPTSTNASTDIKIYWKLDGDGRHNDIPSTLLTTSISKKTLTVTAKALTIQWGNSIVTGTGLVTTSGLVDGDSLTNITLTPSTSDLTDKGTITPSGAVTTKGANNYNITYNTGTLTINKREITITAKSLSVTYGTGITTGTGQVTISGSGLANSNSLKSINLAASRSTVGSGTITPSAAVIKNGTTDLTNKYNITYNTGTLTITAKALTITAKNQSISFGDSIATGTGQVTVSGLISGDSLTGISLAASTTAVTTSGTITPSSATTTNGANNYSITYNTGSLTIGKRAITITAKALTVNYGTAISLGTTYVTTSSLGRLTLSSITLTLSTTNAGTGTITPSNAIIKDGTTDVTNSCTLTYNTGTLTINKVAATKTNPTKVNLTYNGSALNLAKAGTSSHGTFTYKLASASTYGSIPQATNVGNDYTIEWQFTPDSNHTGSDSGSFTSTISAKALTITAKAQSVTFGSSIATGTSQVTVSGLASGDSLTSITLTASTTTVTTNGTITPSAASTTKGASNYSITYNTGTLTITKKALTITAKALTITYGNSIATGTGQVTTSGLISGDSLTAITLTASTTNVPGGTITPSGATCTKGISNYDVTYNTGTLTINQATGSVSISGVSLSYNGSARNLATVNNPTGTMHYRLGTGGSWLTTIPQATNHSDNAYEVYWYMDASTNYTGLYSSSSPSKVTSTIAKINPTITNPTPKTNLVYTGSELVLWNSGSNTTAGSFSYSKGTNAGSYSATWSFTPTDTTNYNTKSGSATISIAKAAGSISYATTTVSKTYGNAAFTNTLTKSGDGSVTYSSSSTGVATVNSSGQVTIVAKGSATITATVADGTNYTYATKTASYTLSVAARTVTITAPTKTNRTYTGSAQTIFALGSCTAGGTMYYSDTNKTFSTSTWSTALPYSLKTDAGTYTLYYYCYVSDTTNNTGSNINTILSVSATIAQGTRSGAISCNNVTYGSTVLASVSVNPTNWTGGTVTWGITNGTGTATINSSGVVTPTKAGTVTITASVGASGNYAAYTATSKLITISLRTVTPTAPTATNRNYTGSAQTIFSGGSSTTGGTMYYSDTNKDFSTSTWSTSLPYTLKTDTGTYTIYWYCYVSDTTNNTGTNINTKKSVSATINKVAATLPGTISGDRKDTDHTPARATVSKDYVGGTLQYSTDNGSTWNNVTWYSGNLTANPSTSTIGDVSVKFRVNPDGNHTVSSTSDAITLTVTKSTDATVTVSLSNTLTYTGSAQTIATASNAHGLSSYYIGYRKGAQATADSLITWNSASTTPLLATNAGDYYVYYKFTVDSSHSGDKAYTYVGKVTINKKSRSGAVSCNNVIYGSTVTASVSGNTESGTITWGITAGTGTATISGGVVTPTKVGKVTVTASVAATANYAAYTATSKEITISLRNVTWSAPTRTNRTYNGNDLTIFTAGSCTAGGTMKYSSDNSTWSTSLPYTLKKEPGTYTIYYKCEVSDTTNNTGTNINTSYSLSATISKISTNAPVLTAGTKATYDGNYVYATAKNGSGNPAGTIYYGASSGSTSYSITASTTATNLSSMGRKNVGTTTIYAFFRPTDTSHYLDSSSANTTASVTNRATGSSGSVSNPAAQTYKASGTYSYQLGISGATGTVTYPTSITVKNSSNTTISGWTCTSAGVVTVPAATTAGSYSVTGNITVALSTNYNAVSATSKTWTITISKANLTAPTATGATVAYHNTATASASGGGGFGTLTWTNGNSRTAVGSQSTAAYWSGDANHNASPNSNSVNLVVNKATDLSVTVTLTNRNYTGSALTIASATSHGCTYYLGTGTSSAVSSWANASTSITATNAGTYYIWYKGTADGNHSADVSATYKGSVTINKIDPTITAPTAKTGLTYSGSSQTLYNAGSNTTAGSFSYTNGTRTDAGTLTVSWTFTPTDTTNYNTKSGSFGVTIARAKTASASASNKTYNGTTESNGTAQTGVTGSNVSWRGDTSGTNAGSYTAYATPTSNYAWSDGTYAEKTITWTMSRRGLTAPVLNASSVTYPSTATASIKTAGTVSGGTATAPGTLTWTNQSRSAIGSQTATAYYAATTTNFSASAASTGVTVQVSKYTPTVTLSATNRKYNGNALYATASITTPSGGATMKGTIYYGTSSGAQTYSVTYSGSGSVNLSSVSVTNVGSATVYAYFVPDSTCSGVYNNSGNASKTFTISKADQSAPTATGASTTYPNTATASASGGGSQGTLTWTNGNTQSGTSVGSKTTKAYWAGNSNYNASPYSNEVTLSVSKATPTVNLSATNRAYNGSALYATASVSVPSGGATPKGTIYYGTSSGATTYSVTYSGSAVNLSSVSVTNVGSATVYAYFTPDSSCSGVYNNSGNASKTFSVSKANLSAPTASVTTAIYPNTSTASASGGGGQGTLTWTNGSSRSAIGTQDTYAYWAGNSNYNASPNSNKVTLSVSKYTPTVTLTATDRAYNGSALYATASIATPSGGKTMKGTIYYGTSSGATTYNVAYSGSGSVNLSSVSVTNVGNNTVYAYFVPDSTCNDVYNLSGNVSKKFTVSKASLTITAKAQTITYGNSIATGTGQVTTSGLVSGDSLTAVTLTASRSTAGTGTITPSAATTTKGIGNYSVTYTAGTLTINKANPTVSLVTLLTTYPTTAYAYFYSNVAGKVYETHNGTQLTASNYSTASQKNANVTAGNGSSTNACTVDSGSGGGNSWTIYTYFVPTDTANYNGIASGPKTLSVANAVANTGSVSNPSAKTFSTSAQTAQLGITGASGTVTYPTSITVKNSGGTTISGWSCTSAGVVTIPASTGTGSYTVTGTISVAAATNYNSGTASKTWTVTINAKSISIPTPTNVSKVYDASAATIAFSAATGATITKYRYGTNGTSWTEKTTNPSQIAKGTLYVQAYYTASTNYTGSGWSSSATITINARPIAVTAGSKSKTYDGTALTYNNATAEATGTNRGLVSGHSMTSYSVSGTITTKGSANNVPSAVVIKSGTTDVTSNYSISYIKGTLTINARAVTSTATNESWIYNGSSHNAANTGSTTNLPTGHTATYTCSGSITDVGTATKTLSTVVIKNSGGTDVSSSFTITKNNGTLTVITNFKPSDSDAFITSDNKYFEVVL